MNDGVKYIGGKYEHWDRDLYIEANFLKAGKYLAFVEFDWHSSVDVNKREFSINNYGLGRARMVDVSFDIDKLQFLKEAFIAKL